MNPLTRIIIPIKGIRTGKSRLAEILTDQEREALVERLAIRTLDVASRLRRVSIAVVTPDPRVLELCGAMDVTPLRQPGTGLNAGLIQAAGLYESGRTIIVPADLPELSPEDIEAHIAATGIGLSPDTVGTGTNMLSLPRPDAIPFRFGADSFPAHRSAAADAGIAVTVIVRPGLSFDLDTIDDLVRFKGWP